MTTQIIQLPSFMEKYYNDPRKILLEHRRYVFTKEQIFAVLNTAINKKKKVYLISKNGSVLNGGSGHIPLELIKEENIVVVKGGTRKGQMRDKTIESIVGVFLSTECSDFFDTYPDIKVLRDAIEHTKESAYKALYEIQNEKKQFRYMRKGVNNKDYRSTPKTIIKLTDTYVTHGSTTNNKSMVRTIPLNRIGHIEATDRLRNKLRENPAIISK